MPSDRRQGRPQYNAIVASAADIHDIHPASVRETPWQDRAWRFYDSVEELWFAAQIYGSGLGRARLVAAQRPAPGGNPKIMASGEAVDLVDHIAGSVAGQSELLWSIGLNLTVPGIGVLVGNTDNDLTSWQVYSPDMLKTKTSRDREGNEKVETVKVQLGPDRWDELSPETLMIPIWRQHPRKKWEPDSPARHTLNSLAEIELLSRHVQSTGLSRIASNGILLYPQEATFKPRPGVDTKLDPFTYELVEAAQVSIDNPGSASAAIPLPVKAPKDSIESFKHLSFSTPFDEQVLSLREAAIRRLATGMDLPAEQLLGMGDMTHWNAWQVSEDTVRIHLIPMLERVANALTLGYLWPAMNLDPADYPDVMVWVDTSDLTVRPDLSSNAFQLAAVGAIGFPALRRETGFSEEDAPSDAELMQMARAVALMNGKVVSDDGDETGFEERNREGAGPPYSDPESDDRHRTPGPTDPNAEPTTPGRESPVGASALVAACDGVVYRALEKIGNRLRSMTATERLTNPQFDCPPATMHCCIDSPLGFRELNKILDGVVDRIPEIAVRHGVEASALQLILVPYIRDLVNNKEEHQYENLESLLISLTVETAA